MTLTVTDNNSDTSDDTTWAIIVDQTELSIDISSTGIVLKNIGDADAYDVEWNVDVTGGLLGLIDKHLDGTDEELAERMGISEEEFIKLKRDATAVTQVSLSRKWFETDSQKDVCEIDVLEDKKGQNPFEEIQRRDLKEMLTKGLTRAERLILILYYYEEMTMKEIGATLDLSESRVSQMHSSILARLKAQMTHQKNEIQV